MKIYLAGHFPQMNKSDNEVKVMGHSSIGGKRYRRLVSFYYKASATIVINALDEHNLTATEPKDYIDNPGAPHQ